MDNQEAIRDANAGELAVDTHQARQSFLIWKCFETSKLRIIVSILPKTSHTEAVRPEMSSCNCRTLPGTRKEKVLYLQAQYIAIPHLPCFKIKSQTPRLCLPAVCPKSLLKGDFPYNN